MINLAPFVLSALFFGGLVNFAILLFIIISANSDMSHSGKNYVVLQYTCPQIKSVYIATAYVFGG